MPVIGVLVILLQIFFAAHAIRTGKDTFWLWVIILAPGIGCALYFITQFGPDAASSSTARKAKNTLLRAVDPQREFRKRVEMLEISNTVENRTALADECVDAGMYKEAIELLKESLVGVHETDPGVMERLAFAYFEHGQPDKTASTLDRLIAVNPEYKSPDGHLLYARALEAQGKMSEAAREYDALRTSYPGEEARVRYGQMLLKAGNNAKAAELFRESLTRAKQAPSQYRKKEVEWLKIAERHKA